MHKHIFYTIFFLLFSCNSGFLLAAQKDDLLTIYHDSLKYDPSLSEAKYQKEYALKETQKVKSKLWPSVSLGLTSQYQYTEITDQKCNSRSNSRSSGINVNLKQPLFSPITWSAISVGKISDNKAELVYKLLQQQHILKIAGAYFELLKTKDSFKEAQLQEAALKEYKEQAKDLFSVGISKESDLLQSEAAYETAKALTLEKELDIFINIKHLESLIGRKPQQLKVLNDNFSSNVLDKSQLTTIQAKASNNNISILLANLEVKEQEEMISLHKRKHLPNIELFSSFQQNFVYDTKAANSNAFSVGVQLNLPIYSGGEVSLEVRQAAILLNKAYKQLENSKIKIMLDIEKTFARLVSTVKILEAQQKSIIASEKALKVTHDSYQAGSKSLTKVLDAQKEVFAIRSKFNGAKYMLIMDYLQLKFLCGDISEEDLKLLNNYLVVSL